jgi:hypothetical protein
MHPHRFVLFEFCMAGSRQAATLPASAKFSALADGTGLYGGGDRSNTGSIHAISWLRLAAEMPR